MTSLILCRCKKLKIQQPIGSSFYDFLDNRLTPREVRKHILENNWKTVVGFQTRNPMHRAHKEIMQRAAEEIGGKALLHPVVGMTKQGDVDYFTRVRCYQKIIKYGEF